jgi:2-polyprenyl-3-methyl-5-hydroxy-6-metoxy-1,4-benzoquinol methylase
MDPNRPVESSTLRFHKSFAGFDRRTELKHPRIQKVQDLIGPQAKGLKILDLGCAGGYTVKPFIAENEVWGADGIDELLEIAKTNGLKTVKVDLEEPLPIADGQFDLVVCTETLEHIVNTDLALHEINRILKPGGAAMLSVPNVRTLIGIGMMFLGYPPMYAARYRSPHFRDFTKKTFRLALQNHGFEIKRIMGGTFWFPVWGDCLSWLATLLPSWSATIIVHAIKRQESTYHPDQNISDVYG